jgi:hypothetical protein
MKSWFLSKTIWFNVLTIVIAIAAHFGWTPDPALTATVANGLVAVAPVVNIFLRFVTKQPVTTLF